MKYYPLNFFNHLIICLKTFLPHRLYKRSGGQCGWGCKSPTCTLRAEPEAFAAGLQVTHEKKLSGALPVSAS